MASDMTGSAKDRFRPIRMIGTGGAANVWLVKDLERGDQAALKVAHAGTTERPDLIERFEREAELLDVLDHPSVLALRARSPSGKEDRPWMAVEYMARGSLADILLREDPPEPVQVVEWTLQLLDALSYLHSMSIVHRDIKPDNLLIDADGCAVLADLGIARLPGSNRTAIGSVFGTPAFMSPEQLEDASKVGASTDVYAAGVVLFNAVSRSSGMQLLLLEKRKKALNKLPPALRGVVDRATRHKLPERYPTADDMAADLADVLDELSYQP
jgi:serine/threonine-protein kinase